MQIHVDGNYQALDQPALRARDQGFLFGEAVYEGVKILARCPLFLEAHLERLERSATALELDVPWSLPDLRAILTRLLADFDGDTGLARLYATRGSAEGAPSALVWIDPLPHYSHPDTPPWRLACHPEPIVPYLPGVKHTNRSSHARARRLAHRSGADDALLVHANGWVLEGPQSNLFFFEADTLHTPETGCGVLAGITRDVVLRLAPGCGFRTVEGRYPPESVREADEWFLTFTSAGIKPVRAIDDAVLPAPGPRTEKLMVAYEQHVEETLASTEPL
jgi:branched-subunit amino acid aminotransferase/4-amino-4-deoxychorismate lyase